MYILYALIVIFATTIGAIAGLGGGVIIKPLLDLLNMHDAQTIGVLSAIAVFTMSIVSTYKQSAAGAKFHMNIVVFISFGSILGGFLGEALLNYIATMLNNDAVLKFVQAGCLLATLLLVLVYAVKKDRWKTMKIRNNVVITLVGLVLGVVSVFLGIGGGPLNIAALSLFFSFDMKEAVIYSIATIFFAQLSKLIQVFFTNQFAPYDPILIGCICIAAVLGGYIGTKINQRLSTKKVERVYMVTLGGLILLSLYNMVKIWL